MCCLNQLAWSTSSKAYISADPELSTGRRQPARSVKSGSSVSGGTIILTSKETISSAEFISPIQLLGTTSAFLLAVIGVTYSIPPTVSNAIVKLKLAETELMAMPT